MSGKYKCPKCGGAHFATTSTRWRCETCGQAYACVAGMPKLFVEAAVGAHDRKLRDTFYDGVFGRFYQFTMPFIVMPVRPWAIAWPHWLTWAATWVMLIGLVAAIVRLLTIPDGLPAALVLAAVLAALIWALRRQRYLFDLLLLALPAWLSLQRHKYVPAETFPQVHARVLAPLRAAGRRLQVLDVSTGSCNSLYKHGWMDLDADYTAVDLSETMLRQGSEMMSRAGVAVDLVVGDAMALPFQDDSFDVVLSYGAVNGLTDPPKAIAEMARVAKPGATLLFLDEQMYDAATPIERAYFAKVLSSHNVIHHCPVDQFPPSLTDVRVSQVYEFYYICTATKAG